MPKSIDEILDDPQLNEILDRLETNKKSKKIKKVFQFQRQPSN